MRTREPDPALEMPYEGESDDQFERRMMHAIVKVAIDRVSQGMPPTMTFGLVMWSRETGQVVGGCAGSGPRDSHAFALAARAVANHAGGDA